MFDLSGKYLNGSSPYIKELTYDIANRELVLICVDNSDDFNAKKRVVFSGVKSYSEELKPDSNDDDLVDSIIGMTWYREDVFCLNTEKREIMIGVDFEPVSSNLA